MSKPGEKELLRRFFREVIGRTDVASFYILTPIPGTEQYDEFMTQGLLTEPNLDRYDGTCVTWRHPTLAPDRWKELLLGCYREFYSLRDVTKKILRQALARWDFRTSAALTALVGYATLQRLSASRGEHPGSGGSGRVQLDQAADYAHLRRDMFGYDLVPLPRSLALSARDEELNRHAKLAVVS